jgi:hypothetical protein
MKNRGMASPSAGQVSLLKLERHADTRSASRTSRTSDSAASRELVKDRIAQNT